MLNLKLAGPNMPVPELETLLPALGVVLPAGSRLEGGTASVMLAMEGAADKLVTSGSLALNNIRLTGFDLGKRMVVVRISRDCVVPDALSEVGPTCAMSFTFEAIKRAVGEAYGVVSEE